MSDKLCSLVRKNVHMEDTKTYKKLIREPKYWCKKCGRAAAKSSCLCKPKKI